MASAFRGCGEGPRLRSNHDASVLSCEPVCGASGRSRVPMCRGRQTMGGFDGEVSVSVEWLPSFSPRYETAPGYELRRGSTCGHAGLNRRTSLFHAATLLLIHVILKRLGPKEEPLAAHSMKYSRLRSGMSNRPIAKPPPEIMRVFCVRSTR